MQKLIALYGHPTDKDAFRQYYETVHVPLARALPGLLECRYAFGVQALGGDSPYFCIFEGDFADAAAMEQALASPEGRAVAADIPNYATGGVTLLTYAL